MKSFRLLTTLSFATAIGATFMACRVAPPRAPENAVAYSAISDATIHLAPKYSTDPKLGLYGPGQFGQALGLCADGPIYPVVFSEKSVPAGTVSFWLKPERYLAGTFAGKGILSLSDNNQSLDFHTYHDPTVGRQLRLSVAPTSSKNRWYVLNMPFGDKYMEKFHHVLLSWDRDRLTVYLDGEAVVDKRRDKSGPWIAPLDAATARVAFSGFCSWLDDAFILERAMTDKEVKALTAVPRPPNGPFAFYAAFDGDLAASARVDKGGDGVRAFISPGVPVATFCEKDTLKMSFSAINVSTKTRNLILSEEIKDLEKRVVLKKEVPLAVTMGQRADIALDLSELGEKGLFWGYFSLRDGDANLWKETVPFAISLGGNAQRLPPDDCHGGLVIAYDYNPARFDKWDRVDYECQWRNLERAPDTWDFGRLDMLVDTIVGGGRCPILSLACPPDWRLSKTNGRKYFNPDDLDGWKRYVRAVGERYKGKVFDYMFIGEAYHKVTVKAISTKEYIQMVNASAEVLKQVDPTIRAGADICSHKPDYNRTLAEQTAGKAAFYIVHSYGFINGAAERLVDDTLFDEKIVRVLKQANASPILANTEVGAYTLMGLAVHPDGWPMTLAEFEKSGNWSKWPKHHLERGRENFVDFITGAFRVVRGTVMDKAVDCRFTMQWCLTPGGFSSLLYRPNAPSPISVAFANACAFLGGTTFVERLDFGANIKSYVFKNGAEYRLCVFTDALATSSDIYLKLPENFALTDHYGNPVPAVRFGPVVKLTLAPLTPLFVTGLNAPPKACPPPLSARFPAGKILPGAPLTLTVTAWNSLNTPLTGEISLVPPENFARPPAKSITLSPESGKTFSLDLSVPLTVTGKQTLTLLLKTANEAIGEFRENIDFMVAPSAVASAPPAGFILDGKLDEWGDTNNFPIRIDRPEQVKIGNPYTQSYVNVDGKAIIDWAGPGDLSARAAIAVDTQYVYLAIACADDRPDTAGDFLELFIAPSTVKDGVIPNRDIIRMKIAPHIPDYPAAKIQFLSPTGNVRGMPVALTDGLAARAALTPTGYAVEIRLPLSNLKKSPDAAFLFDLSVGDGGDSRKSTAILYWAGGPENEKKTESYGVVIVPQKP